MSKLTSYEWKCIHNKRPMFGHNHPLFLPIYLALTLPCHPLYSPFRISHIPTLLLVRLTCNLCRWRDRCKSLCRWVGRVSGSPQAQTWRPVQTSLVTVSRTRSSEPPRHQLVQPSEKWSNCTKKDAEKHSMRETPTLRNSCGVRISCLWLRFSSKPPCWWSWSVPSEVEEACKSVWDPSDLFSFVLLETLFLLFWLSLTFLSLSFCTEASLLLPFLWLLEELTIPSFVHKNKTNLFLKMR